MSFAIDIPGLILQGYYSLIPKGDFEFLRTKHKYFCHWYNRTWANERVVEVPIVMKFVRRAEGRRILEVGNVLSHYYKCSHDVVDKYEMARGVLNVDVVEFSPQVPYDLIVSISTLEHVGWDEDDRAPGKIRRAIDNLLDKCLAPGGLMVATFPLGHNPHVDEMLGTKVTRFDEFHFLKRISPRNFWTEVSMEEARGAAYGLPYPFANVVTIALARKPEGFAPAAHSPI